MIFKYDKGGVPVFSRKLSCENQFFQGLETRFLKFKVYQEFQCLNPVDKYKVSPMNFLLTSFLNL